MDHPRGGRVVGRKNVYIGGEVEVTLCLKSELGLSCFRDQGVDRNLSSAPGSETCDKFFADLKSG